MSEVPHNLQGKTILIADDEELIRELIILRLKDYGAKCIEVSNGKMAYKKISEEKIDLLLSDVKMPGGSGLELLEELSKSSLKSFPIIMMSGFSDLTLEKAKELGAETLVQKPFSVSHIIKVILEVLK